MNEREYQELKKIIATFVVAVTSFSIAFIIGFLIINGMMK